MRLFLVISPSDIEGLFVEMDGKSDEEEEDWVSRDLTMGAVKLRVTDHKPRCVMTTRSQGDPPQDRAVFMTVKKMNDGNAGIELKTQQSGTLYAGDPVSLVI